MAFAAVKVVSRVPDFSAKEMPKRIRLVLASKGRWLMFNVFLPAKDMIKSAALAIQNI